MFHKALSTASCFTGRIVENDGGKGLMFLTRCAFATGPPLLNNNSGRQPFKLVDTPPHVLGGPMIVTALFRFKIAWQMRSIDPSFRYNEFSMGAVQSLITVSNLLARGDFESLKLLVNEQALDVIRRNHSLLSDTQKAMIAVRSASELYFAPIPYQIEVVRSPQTQVKISCLFFTGRPSELLDGAWDGRTTLSEIKQQMEKAKQTMMVADYKFVRIYDARNDTGWSIYELNHCLVSEHPDKYNFF